MGNTVSSAMKEAQTEMIAKQIAEQRAVQAQMMERQMRIMSAMNVARARDLVQWQLGFGAVALTGLLATTLKTGTFPRLAIAPMAVFTTVTLYNADMAYGNKMNRINAEAALLRNDASYWFSPVLVPRDAMQEVYGDSSCMPPQVPPSSGPTTAASSGKA